MHNKTVAVLGMILFGPSLLLLAKQSNAVALVQAMLPHLPSIELQLLGAILSGIAGLLLYLGKPFLVNCNQDNTPN